MDSIRQAAILVAALDMDAADALLEQMPEDFAAAVRRQVMELDDVDTAEEQAVIGKFLGREESTAEDTLVLSTDDSHEDSAVSLQDYLAQGHHDAANKAATHSDEESVSWETEQSAEPPFEFLQEADDVTLSNALQHEHPQVVALVLSHAESRLAAAVLSGLPDGMQVDVARRMAGLEEVDSQTLREIEAGLRPLLAMQTNARGERTGLRAIQQIVATTDESGSSILKNVELADANLAARLTSGVTATQSPQHNDDQRQASPPVKHRISLAPVEFSTLETLGDDHLGKVLQHADGRTLLLALAGASPSLMKKVYNQLPRDDAQALRRQIEQQGTILLRDVEEAQRRIGLVAAKLAAGGEIPLPTTQRLAVAA